MSRLTRLFRAAAVAAAAAAGADRAAAQPCPTPGAPCAQPGCQTPQYQFPWAGTPGQAPPADTGTANLPPAEPTPSFSNILGGAGVGETAAVGMGGYIDQATPVTMFRMRYDSAYDNNRPDRAEYFYAKCGCFRFVTPPQLNAAGPPSPETRVDYQELDPYFEYAVMPRLSFFTTVPVRFINPQVNPNAAGLGDVSYGFKYALLYSAARVLTFQLRGIAPTGSPGAGLGTGNWWIEPGLLYLQMIGCRWQVFGQFKDQIPLAPRSDFTGNVLNYGLGTSVFAYQTEAAYVAPVLEMVGWTVLSGKELADGTAVSARGDTIVNAKIGVRVGFGKPTGLGPFPTANDVYIGYGRALTGDVWYKNILRLEYRRFF